MDKIDKLLSKIPRKDALKIALVLEKIVKNKLVDLNIMKLKGSENIFRARAGKYRIIYKKTLDKIRVLEISKRNDNTYKNY